MGILSFKSEEEKEREQLENEFFSLIENSMTYAYKENQTSVINQAISLQKKDFVTAIATQRLNVKDESQLFINWKRYILQYLQRESGRYSWAHILYNQFSHESFPNQLKFQSEFFYYEFKIMTCSKSIRKALDEEENENEEFTSKLNLSNNFMGSFASFYADSFQSNEPTMEYKKCKSKINEYMKIFKAHVFNQDHPIFIIINSFSREITNEIEKEINKLEIQKGNSDYQSILKKTNEEIISQITEFIIEMQIVIKLFYSQAISLQFFREEKDEFINLLLSLLFKTGNLYEKIYRILELSLEEKVEKFRNKLIRFANVKPQDLGIENKFCLNEETKQLQLELIAKNEENSENKDILISDQNEEEQKEKFININEVDNKNCKMSPEQNELIINSDSKDTEKGKLNEKDIIVSSESYKLMKFSHMNRGNEFSPIENNDKKEPYEEAINLLRSVKRYTVPLEKLIVIASISAEITACVNEYWKNMEKYMTASLLHIDADELMTIFIYIIIKSQLPELFIHSAFVKNFTTPSTKSSMMGYYLTTLEGSLNFLLDINSIEEISKSDRNNKTDDSGKNE